MPTNEVICTCAEIKKHLIIDIIKKYKTKDIDLVCKKTGAGIVCGGCRPVIQEIINKYYK